MITERTNHRSSVDACRQRIMKKATSPIMTITKTSTVTMTAESVLLPLRVNDVLSSAVVTSTATAVIKTMVYM